MAQRNARAGRPRKYRDGWESVNTRIYLSKETLIQWHRIKSEQNLASDNAMALFLLEQYRALTDLQVALPDERRVNNR